MVEQPQQAQGADAAVAEVPDLNNPGRNPDDPTRQPPDHPGRDDDEAVGVGEDNDGARGQEPPGQGHPRD